MNVILWGSYQELHIEAVGEQIVGPTEVRRLLGPEIADAIPLQGSFRGSNFRMFGSVTPSLARFDVALALELWVDLSREATESCSRGR